jgi:alpha-1,6-mannosyltransferase
MSRVARWWLAMALVLIVCGLIAGDLTNHLRPVSDPRFRYDFAYGLTLPIPVVADAVGGWPIVVVFWIAVALVAFVGNRLARALADDRRESFAPIVLCFGVIGLLATLWPIAFGGDLYASVAYGRLYSLYRINPYIFDQAVRIGHDFILQRCLESYGNPPPGDSYGPLWTLLAGALARIGSGAALAVQIWSHRFVALVCTAASLVGLLRVWRGLPVAERKLRVATFAFHPVIIFEAVAAGHNDAIMLAFAVWSFALAADMPLVAGVLIGAACAVKLSAFVALPFVVVAIWRRHRAIDALLAVAAAAAVVVVAFVPFWQGPATLTPIFAGEPYPRSSPTWLVEVALLRYVPGSAPIVGRLTIPSLITIGASVGLAAVVVWSLVLFARSGKAANLWRSVTALLWSIPNIYPWYLIWLSPALSSRGAWATFAWWFALLAFVHYAVDVPRLPDTTVAYDWTFFCTVVATLAFLIVPIIIARRREGRSAAA